MYRYYKENPKFLLTENYAALHSHFSVYKQNFLARELHFSVQLMAPCSYPVYVTNAP